MTKDELFELIDLRVDGLRHKAILKDAIEDLLKQNDLLSDCEEMLNDKIKEQRLDIIFWVYAVLNLIGLIYLIFNSFKN